MKTRIVPFKGLTPVATPVDTYVRPTEQAVAKLDQSQATAFAGVANALAQVNPKINNYFQELKKTQDAEAEAKGYNEAIENNRSGWNEFLDETKSTDPDRYEQYAGSNPHLKKGWDRAWLEGQTMDYSDSLDAFLLNPEVTLTDGSKGNLFDMDQRDVSDYMNQHLSDFMDERGVSQLDALDVEEHFASKAMSLQNGMRSQEMRERRAAMVENRVAQVGQTTLQRITQAMKTVSWNTEPGATHQALGAIIGEEIAKAHNDGVRDFTKLNARVGKSIIALATDMRDDSVLNVLDWVETKEGGGLNAEGKLRNSIGNSLATEITNARISIMRLQNDKVRVDRANAKFAQDAFVDKVTGDLYEALASAKNDPEQNVGSVDISSSTAQLRSRGLNFKAEALEQMKTRMMRAENFVQSDIPTLAVYQRRIMAGTMNNDAIYAGMGELYSEEVGQRMIAENRFWKTREVKAVSDVIDKSVRNIMTQITGSDTITAGMSNALKQRGHEAVDLYQTNFMIAVREWKSKNEGVTPDALEMKTINSAVIKDILNDNLFRTAGSTTTQVRSPDELNQARDLLGPDASQGSSDFYRLPPEEVEEGLDTGAFLGDTYEDFEANVTQYQETGRGQLALLIVHLYGMDATEEQKQAIVQRQVVYYNQLKTKQKPKR